MRKLFYLLLCVLWISNIIYSQAPQAFNYQAVVRDKAGEVLKAQPLEIQITILSDSLQDTIVYEEIHSTTTSNAGTISLQIGKGIPLQGKFEEINWASGKNYFLNTSFTLNNEKIILGAIQILSVPYALYAQHSGEKHDLILKGGMLSIDGGGAGVKLPGGGSSGSCLWEQGVGEIYREGAISLKNKNLPYLQAHSDIDGIGHLRLNYKGDKSITFDQGEIITYNTGEQPKVKITNTSNSENGGIGVWGGGVERISLLTPQIEGGISTKISMKGKDGIKPLVYLTATDYGNLLFSGSQGKSAAYISGSGGIELWGQNGKSNVSIGSINTCDNCGGVWTHNPDGKNLVMITATEGTTDSGAIGVCYKGEQKGRFQIINGKSCLTTDEIFLNGTQLHSSTTNYSSTLKSSSDYAPCFVSESTDNQITFRGTATLNNGKFKVILPPQETEKIAENSITIQVIPLSADSKGLAVLQKNNHSFTVAELMAGTGNYDFDWTLTALIKETEQLRNSNNYNCSEPTFKGLEKESISSLLDKN